MSKKSTTPKKPALCTLARAFADATIDNSCETYWSITAGHEVKLDPMLNAALNLYESMFGWKADRALTAARAALPKAQQKAFDRALVIHQAAAAEMGYQVAVAALTKRHDARTLWSRLARAVLARVHGDVAVAALLLKITPEQMQKHLEWPVLLEHSEAVAPEAQTVARA